MMLSSELALVRMVSVNCRCWGDNVVSSNLHPYTGPTMTLGADGLYKRLRVGGEFYAAPWGGLSDPKTADGADVVREPCAGTCGAIYTARLRVGVEL